MSKCLETSPSVNECVTSGNIMFVVWTIDACEFSEQIPVSTLNVNLEHSPTSFHASQPITHYKPKTLLKPASQSLLVVGSHAQGEYSPVSSVFMSSGLNSKSKILALSSMRDLVTDFGSVTKPCFR